MSIIIGFTGKLGSGKDAAADRLVSQLRGAAVVRGSFARPLKQSAAALLDIPVADWEVYKNDPGVKVLLQVGYKDEPTQIVQDWTDDGEPIPFDYDEPNIVREFTAREFLQRYGTESHRDVFGQDFWVEQAFNVEDDWDVLVFTDCRFENEAEAIRGRGGVVVRVKGANEQTGGHVSEAGLPDHLVDYEVRNDVRGDNFVKLDRELDLLAKKLHIPHYLFHPVGAVAS